MIQVEARPAFFTDGLCHGRPQILHLFYPDDEEREAAAGKQYCERCPVKQQCLDYALGQNILFGLWGGLTPRERVRYERNPAAFVMKKSTCEECGELLHGNQRLFCGPRCVRKASSRRKRQGAQLMPVICEMCGEEFPRRSAGQKLCSDECRKASANLRTARNRETALRTVGCWICGAPTSSYAKYCSDPCRAKARKNTQNRYYEKRKFAS